VFKVGTVANLCMGNTDIYSFTVLRPWYRNSAALFFYGYWHKLSINLVSVITEEDKLIEKIIVYWKLRA
jgi:hypothetical protein